MFEHPSSFEPQEIDNLIVGVKDHIPDLECDEFYMHYRVLRPFLIKGNCPSSEDVVASIMDRRRKIRCSKIKSQIRPTRIKSWKSIK